MKVVVQRVSNASCVVAGKLISEITNGYLLLTGFTHQDTVEDVKYLAKKIANLRIFEDDNGKLNKSICEKQYQILNISQFTLYGNAQKGNRPSFTEAMEPFRANELYLELSRQLNDEYNIPTFNGVFGAQMTIALTNDGPVTIILRSKEK